MVNKTIIDEINQAKLTLQLSDAQLHLLPEKEASAVFHSVEAHFIIGTNWTWWEHFQSPAAWVHFSDNKGFERLTSLVPSASESVWFIAEDSRLRSSPVYEADTATIQSVVSQCYGFEYYLIAKDLSWLLGENHHSALFGVGEPVRSNMTALLSQNGIG